MPEHRRRIKTYKKANVVAAVGEGGGEIYSSQFLATLAILYQDDMKKGMNLSNSSYRPGAIRPFL